jgi:hypothetical protein
MYALGTPLTFAAILTLASNSTAATGKTVNVSVYRLGTVAPIVSAQAATEVGGTGMYTYTLAGANTITSGDYVALFTCADTTVSARLVGAIQSVRGWVSNIASLGLNVEDITAANQAIFNLSESIFNTVEAFSNIAPVRISDDKQVLLVDLPVGYPALHAVFSLPNEDDYYIWSRADAEWVVSSNVVGQPVADYAFVCPSASRSLSASEYEAEVGGFVGLSLFDYANGDVAGPLRVEFYADTIIPTTTTSPSNLVASGWVQIKRVGSVLTFEPAFAPEEIATAVWGHPNRSLTSENDAAGVSQTVTLPLGNKGICHKYNAGASSPDIEEQLTGECGHPVSLVGRTVTASLFKRGSATAQTNFTDRASKPITDFAAKGYVGVEIKSGDFAEAGTYVLVWQAVGVDEHDVVTWSTEVVVR